MVDLNEAAWRKSTYSENNGCVEVAFIEDTVAVRDSKGLHPRDQPRPVLIFSRGEWKLFLDRVHGGDLDLPR
jgi:hypothetical protein